MNGEVRPEITAEAQRRDTAAQRQTGGGGQKVIQKSSSALILVKNILLTLNTEHVWCVTVSLYHTHHVTSDLSSCPSSRSSTACDSGNIQLPETQQHRARKHHHYTPCARTLTELRRISTISEGEIGRILWNGFENALQSYYQLTALPDYSNVINTQRKD